MRMCVDFYVAILCVCCVCVCVCVFVCVCVWRGGGGWVYVVSGKMACDSSLIVNQLQLCTDIISTPAISVSIMESINISLSWKRMDREGTVAS